MTEIVTPEQYRALVAGQPVKGKVKKQAEGMIVNAAIRWLYAHQIFVWRNNSGGLRDANGRLIRYGLPGSSDILGLFPAHSVYPGRMLCVEAKTDSGRLSDPQKAFQQKIIDSGGLYLIARSVDDLEEHVKPLLKMP